MDQDAIRIEMQQGSKCNKDQDAMKGLDEMKIKMHVRINIQNIKVQHGSKYNEAMDAWSININQR